MTGMYNNIGAVVLAAGYGARMGTPKLLLQKEGKSYLEFILDLLIHEKIGPIVSIVGSAQETWARRFKGKTTLVINPHPEQGMLLSIKLGIATLENCSGLFIVPVDHPFIRAETFHTLKQQFIENPDAIVKPSFQKQSGHPIIIPHALYATVQAAERDSTLRRLLQQTDARRLYVNVNDDGILKNINKWDDLTVGEIAQNTHTALDNNGLPAVPGSPLSSTT